MHNQCDRIHGENALNRIRKLPYRPALLQGTAPCCDSQQAVYSPQNCHIQDKAYQYAQMNPL